MKEILLTLMVKWQVFSQNGPTVHFFNEIYLYLDRLIWRVLLETKHDIVCI